MGHAEGKIEPALPDFSIAFQQTVSVVAIAKTSNTRDTIDELVKQCFAVLPDEPLRTSSEVAEAVNTIFRVQLSVQDVTSSIERLLNRHELSELPGGQWGLIPEQQTIVEDRIEATRRLQEDVKKSWLQSVATDHPNLDLDRLWKVLGSYLAQAFRRHGIQTIALLDPAAQVDGQLIGGLSPLLRDEIGREFTEQERDEVWTVVNSFFSTVGSDRKRAAYISQLADAAFNYFSLTVAPDVAERLRNKLNPLFLFLDTNFLFGILDLHVNSQVEVSRELMRVIHQYNFPFRLRYHQATTREMNNTLVYYGSELRNRKWPQPISRAAVASGRFSGMELRYHILNSNNPVDVEVFLSPYDHWDVILRDQGIDVFNPGKSDSQLRERADLEAEYLKYLTSHNRDKPQDAIQHDMAVLHTVQSLRTSAQSSLDGGALFVTCDIRLFRFDLERSRQKQDNCCVVLPSLFWQLLRPFVPNGEDFDRAFAETFALPEFNLSRGDAAKAASKMLGILASYGNLPEETATRMLANDILLSQFQIKNADGEYYELIDAELARVNEELVEEKVAAIAQLEIEKQQRELAERELVEKKESLLQKQSELAERERSLEEQSRILSEKQTAIERLREERETIEIQARRTAELVLKEQREKEAAETEQRKLLEERDMAEHRAMRIRKLASVIIGILLAILFEVSVHFVFQWEWLLAHPNSYGLQGCAFVMIVSGVIGLGVKTWRNAFWITGVAGALFVALQLLGGPATAN
jgi:hypothetical protein